MSGSPWAILGLAPDAGVADVRRAYARLLRTHRPDEDAAAFQRLHEAYERALGEARWREQNPDFDEDDGRGGDASGDDVDDDGDDIDHVHDGAGAGDVRRADGDSTAAPAFTGDPVRVVGDDHDVAAGHDVVAGELADILGIDRDQVRVRIVDADDPDFEIVDDMREDGARRDTARDDDTRRTDDLRADGDDDHHGAGDDNDGHHHRTHEDPADHFHPAEFFAEFEARLAGDSAIALAAWLDAHPALWSVDRKRALRHGIAQALGEAHEIHDPRAIDATLAFFGMDSVSRDDAWLLEHVESARRRHEDGDRFARRIEAMRAPGGRRTDRLLFDELSRPFAWWRRLLVMAWPGLPTGAAALAGDLRSLDPGSAAATLRAPAVAFWQRAANRAALYPPRLAVAALRLLLFTGIAGANAIATSPETMAPWAWLLTMAGVGAGAWAVWVLPSTGYQWLRAWNARHQRWDPATLMTGTTVLVGAIAMPWLPLMGGFLYFGALLTWLGARGNAAQGNERSKWATLVTFATAVGTVVGTIVIVGGDALPERWVWSIAGPYAFGVLMLHDLLLARRRRILLARAHVETGWLWWLAVGHGLALAGLIAIGANA